MRPHYHIRPLAFLQLFGPHGPSQFPRRIRIDAAFTKKRFHPTESATILALSIVQCNGDFLAPTHVQPDELQRSLARMDNHSSLTEKVAGARPTDDSIVKACQSSTILFREISLTHVTFLAVII